MPPPGSISPPPPPPAPPAPNYWSLDSQVIKISKNTIVLVCVASIGGTTLILTLFVMIRARRAGGRMAEPLPAPPGATPRRRSRALALAPAAPPLRKLTRVCPAADASAPQGGQGGDGG